MKVVVSACEVRKMRERMKKAYPRERVEYLWGELVGNSVHIYIFDQVPHKAALTWCEVSAHDHAESTKDCREAGFVFLGTVHSHPGWRDASPSETDHDNAEGEILNGIVSVWKTKSGARRSRIRWWGPQVPVKTTLTRRKPRHV